MILFFQLLGLCYVLIQTNAKYDVTKHGLYLANSVKAAALDGRTTTQ